MYPPAHITCKATTAKNTLCKSRNDGLLAHRATPGPEGYSPAELLMVPQEYQRQYRQKNARRQAAKNERQAPAAARCNCPDLRHGSQQQGTIVRVWNKEPLLGHKTTSERGTINFTPDLAGNGCTKAANYTTCSGRAIGLLPCLSLCRSALQRGSHIPDGVTTTGNAGTVTKARGDGKKTHRIIVLFAPTHISPPALQQHDSYKHNKEPNKNTSSFSSLNVFRTEDP